MCVQTAPVLRVCSAHTHVFIFISCHPTTPSHPASFLHGRCAHEGVHACMNLGNYLTLCVSSSGTGSSAGPAPTILDARCQREERLGITAACFSLSPLQASDTLVQGCVLKAASNEVKPVLPLLFSSTYTEDRMRAGISWFSMIFKDLRKLSLC